MPRLKTTKRKVIAGKQGSDVGESGPSNRISSSGGRKKSKTGHSQPSVSLSVSERNAKEGTISDVTITSSTETNERENRSTTVKRVVAARSVRTWKPLRTSTKKYALQLFDTATELLLSRSSDAALRDLQTHLARMKRRFSDRLDKSRGPVNNITNYNNLHRLWNTEQQETDGRIEESLQQQLETEERDCRELEESMETYKLYADGASQLHSLLRPEENRQSVQEAPPT